MLISPAALQFLATMTGACALLSLSKKAASSFCRHLLRKKDRCRVQKSKYKSSEHGKALRRKSRKKRKGLEDTEKEREGPVYVPGGFDCEPGPSKRPGTYMQQHILCVSIMYVATCHYSYLFFTFIGNFTRSSVFQFVSHCIFGV